MLGAIIGDIVGSRFEFRNRKSKKFSLFTDKCTFTDDTVMTIAVAKALQESKPDGSDLAEMTVRYMQEIGRKYPKCGYGGRFRDWLASDDPQPYNSYGNGSAMRVSACVDTLEGIDGEEWQRFLDRVETVTAVTHDHPDGIRGAQAIAAAAALAKAGKSIDEIRQYIDEHYYEVDFTLDEIRPYYHFDVSCWGSVPQALAAFYESTGFEDAIRNAVSVGGDSDTIAAMTGAIAEQYYGIPSWMQQTALVYLDGGLLDLYEEYQEWLGVSYVDPASLEDGKVLYMLKKMFLDEPTLQKLEPVLRCLRDSIVKVPGRAVLSEEDQMRFLEAMKKGVGADITTEDEIRFEPEILQNEEGEKYFPIFCNDEQIPEEYTEHFAIRDMFVSRCIQLARLREGVNGLVLDPFTEQVLLPFDFVDFIDRLPSRIRIREDQREMKSNIRFELKTEQLS